MSNKCVLWGTISVVASDATMLQAQTMQTSLKRAGDRFDVLDCASKLRPLIDAVDQFTPNVVLVSINLQDGPTAGLNAIREIHLRHAQTRIIAMMNTRDRNVLINAFRMGANGVVYRSDSFEMLCRCIHSVFEGQVWAGSSDMHQILEALSAAVPVQVVDSNGNDLLTDRQKQIVHLVTQGLTNREIAQQLRLSEHTVKNYLFRIFDKLGISSRAELIIYVIGTHEKLASTA